MNTGSPMQQVVSPEPHQHEELIERACGALDQLLETINAVGPAQLEIGFKAMSASADSEQTAANVAGVATAAEQIAASVHRIAQQTSKSAQVVRSAAGKATHAACVIQSMVKAVGTIQEILSLISGITSQTNMLALNATIEAARAGSAGRGFAVVASEVKALAGQTARATGQITTHLVSLAKISDEALIGVSALNDSIAHIEEFDNVLTVAMVSQDEAIRPISEHAHEAAANTQNLNESISGVARSSDQITDATQQLADVANRIGINLKNVRELPRSGKA